MSESSPVTPIEILLIEDNIGDIILTQKAFEASSHPVNIHIAEDGEIALQMLKKQEPYSQQPTPHIILLDLNLPKKDGHEVLADIKRHEELKTIPVVILTSSQAGKDIIESYGLHANGYIIKPVSLDKFKDVVASIEQFWFNIVELPHSAQQTD